MADDFREYTSGDLKVRWSKSRCIHVGNCVGALPAVFDPERRPWIDPSQAATAEVEAAVRACPTGALQAERVDGTAVETPPPHATIRMAADGPLLVHGDVVLDTGAEIRVALCRCGASVDKPYCDGAHASCGYHEPATAAPRADLPAELGEGEVEVRATPDGPLMLQGPVEIRNGNDEVVFRGDRAALCRCGGSGNPPYCDGTHFGIGFRG